MSREISGGGLAKLSFVPGVTFKQPPPALRKRIARLCCEESLLKTYISTTRLILKNVCAVLVER